MRPATRARRAPRPAAAPPVVAPPLPSHAAARQWTEALHDELTALFTALDGGGAFREDRWERDGGGGGVSRVLSDGTTFEKAGINRSCVEGALPQDAAERLGGRAPQGSGTAQFFATGVSMVIHPRSPRVPTFHLNVRYFELMAADGTTADAWFGGGCDLTPTHPQEQDAHDFHRALRGLCDRHDRRLYAHFKPWCDEYFTNRHRGGEARGVGGIFFDHLRPQEGPVPMDAARLFAFVRAVGRAPFTAYAPIVARRRDEPSDDAERACQLWRRGRYVEFNLLHDRGTRFGLDTQARVESVLMSLPPHAAWPYAPTLGPDTLAGRVAAMLAPRDWGR